MWLGPAIPATCRACGQKIGVPYSSVWTLVPFLIAIGVAAFAPSVELKILLLFVGFVMMSFCHWRFVPLIRR